VKVALALESLDPQPRSRALTVGRRLAGGGEVVLAACLADPSADGRALAARLGLREAFFAADPALAQLGGRGRAQVLARLCSKIRADLILVDAAADGGAGLFSASLALFGEWPGLFRAPEIALDATRPDAVEVTLDLAGVRQRLRVDLPAVVSLVGDGGPCQAIDPALVKSRTFSLSELEVDPATLVPEPLPAPSFVPAHPRPIVVTAIDDLLR
jgi:hypothetical protein